jgi:hypothetical protein
MASPARKFSVVAKEAGNVIGGRRKYCAIVVRSKALSGTLLARHVVFGCKDGTGGRVPREMRGKIWDVTLSLHKRPRPADPLATRSRLGSTPCTRPAVTDDPDHFDYPSTVGIGVLDEAGADTALQSLLEAWIYAPIYGPNHHQPSRRSERPDDKILCELRHPVCGGRHSSFSSFLKTIHPAYANHELRPSRRSMANIRLPELYALTKVLVREALSEWADFAKAALLMEGWESTTNEHIVNVLAVVGDKVYFLESFQTGSDRQGAAG